MPVKVKINEQALQSFLYGQNGPVMRYMQGLTDLVADESERFMPHQSGKLRASLNTDVERRGRRIVGTITSELPYALYVHEGTGIYGPKHDFIYPTTKKFLRFPRGSGGAGGSWGSGTNSRGQAGGGAGGQFVFAKKVKGMRPTPFYWEAMLTVLPANRWRIRRLPYNG